MMLLRAGRMQIYRTPDNLQDFIDEEPKLVGKDSELTPLFTESVSCSWLLVQNATKQDERARAEEKVYRVIIWEGHWDSLKDEDPNRLSVSLTSEDHTQIERELRVTEIQHLNAVRFVQLILTNV